MKRLLLFFVAAFLCSSALSAQVVYEQDFENGIPENWTATGGWVLSDAANFSSAYFTVTEHTMFMGVNDDAAGNGVVSDGAVTSDMIDLADAEAPLVLSFDSFFPNGDYQGIDETAKVYVSVDAGATWDLLLDLEELAGAWNNVQVPVSEFVGQQIWLQFEYIDGDQWNFGWAFDDVRIGAAIERDAMVATGGLFNGAAVGYVDEVSGIITNNGVNNITSIDVNWSDGTNEYTETMEGLNIPLQGTMAFTHPTTFTVVEGQSDISIWVSNVNGMGEDENPANDMVETSITGITPHPDRGVVVEEATGTWCPWCPRGDVFLNGMTERYGKSFIGVAVHNQDPMTLTEYDNAITSFPDFTGFPSVIQQREEVLDPSAIELPSATTMMQAPVAKLTIGAEYDEMTRSLTTSVVADFNEAISGDYRLSVVLTEDGVTGTTDGYNQTNNYAGGGAGPMGGYENLPSTIPASMMVYNHVGRALIGGFDGVQGSLAETVAAGESDGHSFDAYEIPADYDADKMHIVALLLNPAGEIINASTASIEEAVLNGLVSTRDVYRNDLARVYPNPASFNANIALDLESSSNVLVDVYNTIGQRVYSNDFGTMAGSNMIDLNTSNFANGVYTIHINLDGAKIVKKITVQK